jgi:hypothetical protein
LIRLEGPKRYLDLPIAIFGGPLGVKWCNGLADALTCGLLLEKNYSLLGVDLGSRPLQALERSLRAALLTAGEWYQEQWIEQIAQRPDLLEQAGLNAAHHAFEICIGQVWSPNPFYIKAPSRVQFAVRSINNLVHEIEARQRAFHPASPYPTVVASFLRCPRHTLTKEDRPDFRLRSEFGDLYLHYCQLGKTQLEVLHDEDEAIYDQNVSELRYWTCEFDLYLGETEDQSVEKERAPQVQRRDHELGVGRVLIGRLQGMSRESILEEIGQMTFGITRIAVRADGGTWTTGHFPYSIETSEKMAARNGSRNPITRWLARQSAGVWYDHRNHDL